MQYMRQYGKRSFITAVSSERIQFQMVKAGVDQDPPADGAHHLTASDNRRSRGGFPLHQEGVSPGEGCLRNGIKYLALVENFLIVRKAGDKHGHSGISVHSGNVSCSCRIFLGRPWG